MSDPDTLSASLSSLRDELRRLTDRTATLEKAMAVVHAERAHTDQQFAAIREDISGLRAVVNKVAWAIIGSMIAVLVTFAMKGGFGGVP